MRDRETKDQIARRSVVMQELPNLHVSALPALTCCHRTSVTTAGAGLLIGLSEGYKGGVVLDNLARESALSRDSGLSKKVVTNLGF